MATGSRNTRDKLLLILEIVLVALALAFTIYLLKTSLSSTPRVVAGFNKLSHAAPATIPAKANSRKADLILSVEAEGPRLLVSIREQGQAPEKVVSRVRRMFAACAERAYARDENVLGVQTVELEWTSFKELKSATLKPRLPLTPQLDDCFRHRFQKDKHAESRQIAR